MASSRVPETDEQARTPKRSSRCDTDVAPTSQSPDDPIEFEADNDVACGNEERANAEPEPAALHAAQVPGKPDTARERREIEKSAARDSENEKSAARDSENEKSAARASEDEKSAARDSEHDKSASRDSK